MILRQKKKTRRDKIYANLGRSDRLPIPAPLVGFRLPPHQVTTANRQACWPAHHCVHVSRFSNKTTLTLRPHEVLAQLSAQGLLVACHSLFPSIHFSDASFLFSLLLVHNFFSTVTPGPPKAARFLYPRWFPSGHGEYDFFLLLVHCYQFFKHLPILRAMTRLPPRLKRPFPSFPQK